jgi:hypothetical protein
LLFSDDFNRANGPIGNDWVDVVGTSRVVSNSAARLTGTASVALQNCTAGVENVSAQLLIKEGAAGGKHARIIIRSDSTYTNAYMLQLLFSNPGGVPTASIYSMVDGLLTQLLIAQYMPDNSTDHVYLLKAVGSELEVWIDGVRRMQLTDTSVPGGGWAGIGFDDGAVYGDDFAVYQWEAAAGLSIAPTFALQGSVGDLIALYSASANWTPGTPGAPTFTADLGTITAQIVNDASHATLTYNAPLYATVDTIRDPLNGTVAFLRIQELPIGYAPLDPATVEWLNRSAAADPGILPSDTTTIEEQTAGIDVRGVFGELLLGMRDIRGTAARNPESPTLIYTLWDLLSGGEYRGENPTIYAAANGANSQATHAAGQTDAIRTGSNLTLQSIIDQLQGIGDDTLTSLGLQIAGLGEPDYSAILDAIAAIRTENDYTLQSVIDLLDVIRTIHDYTLGDAVDAANAVRGTDNPTIHDVLTAIAALPQTQVDLSGVLSAISAVSDKIDTLQTTANTINTNIGTLSSAISALGVTVNSIVSAISNVAAALLSDTESILGAIAGLIFPTSGPPIWPGDDGVTKGDPVVLTDSAIIEGPMDGILLENMTVGNTKNTWSVTPFAGVYRGGYVVFLSEEGHAEPAQYIGPTDAVFSRQGLSQAAQCVIKLNNVAEVTVTPWTLK